MSYKINRVGPWPIVDIGAAKVTRTSGAALTGANAPLNVCLDTANLGSKTEAFISGEYDGSLAFGISTDVLSFGVCLKPLADISPGPVYLDISINAISGYLETVEGYGDILPMVPFVGFIDSASATLSNGWDAANNLVSNWVPLGGSQNTCLQYNSQVLLKDITSGGLDTDKFICVGFMLFNPDQQNIDPEHLHYMISARYATKSIGATWKES